MNTPLDPAVLRSILQADAVTLPVRIIAFVGSALLFVVVLETVRRRKLREEFTPIWVSWAVVILALGVSFDLLIWFTDLIGAWTPSSTVFFFGLAFLTAISLTYAVHMSAMLNQIKVLAQEIAILKAASPRPTGETKGG